MKKFFKILGILLGVVVVLIIAGAVFVNSKGIPSYEVQKLDFQAVSSPEAILRGKKLSTMLCAGCHLNPETNSFTGKQMKDAPAEFGVVYSQNITQDSEYGIGDWTDGEILYLLRTGIKRDGNYAPPYMAKLPLMADEDINAIIAFLRSDDPLVAADDTPDKPCEPSFLTKFLSNTVFKPFDMPEGKIAMPDTSNQVEFGEYLALNLDCYSCHSADFTTNNFLEPEKSAGFFGGGNKPLDEKGNVMLTMNLTPDPETGIGNWTKEEFINALRFGQKPGEHALRPPMAPYVHLTDYEAGAIFEYLKTIPPIKNKVERSPIYD